MRRHIEPLGAEEVPLLLAPGRVLAREVTARTDSPSADVSLKDGYAVRAEDTVRASRQSPARLRVLGSRFAGERGETKTRPEGCVKITSGAILPEGADAVVGIEFCSETSEGILVSDPVAAGFNVLAQGTDIAAGAALGAPGDRLSPGVAGWLAAAGLEEVPVYRLPSVALVATGDEVVAPGAPLEQGQLYASNLVTLSAWLGVFGIATDLAILPDRRDDLRQELPRAIEGHDALLTSGGAWDSERDLVVGVLEELGWKQVVSSGSNGPGKGCRVRDARGAAGVLPPGRSTKQRDGLSAAGLARRSAAGRLARLTLSVPDRTADRAGERPGHRLDAVQEGTASSRDRRKLPGDAVPHQESPGIDGPGGLPDNGPRRCGGIGGGRVGQRSDASSARSHVFTRIAEEGQERPSSTRVRSLLLRITSLLRTSCPSRWTCNRPRGPARKVHTDRRRLHSYRPGSDPPRGPP